MVKYFCDGCGKQIIGRKHTEEDNNVNENIYCSNKCQWAGAIVCCGKPIDEMTRDEAIKALKLIFSEFREKFDWR